MDLYYARWASGPIGPAGAGGGGCARRGRGRGRGRGSIRGQHSVQVCRRVLLRMTAQQGISFAIYRVRDVTFKKLAHSLLK